MGKAIPPEIRGKIIAFHEAGMSQKWIVRETSIYIADLSPAVYPPPQGGQGAWPAATGGACRQETGRFFSHHFYAKNYGLNTNNNVPCLCYKAINCNGFKNLIFFQVIPKRKVAEENKADGKHETSKSSDGMP